MPDAENSLHLVREQFRNGPPKTAQKRCHYEWGRHTGRAHSPLIPKVILRRVTQKIRILRSVGRSVVPPSVLSSLYNVGPRLRESRLMDPSSRGA